MSARRVIYLAILIPVVILCGACGYTGEPLPPALKLPNRVTDLSAVQRGSRIVIRFTMSRMTTEALPLDTTPEVDLRLGASGSKFDLAGWMRAARRLPDRGKRTEYETPVAEFAGKNVVIAVRLLNRRGRDAGWSNMVSLFVTPPVGRPENVAAKAVAQGVEVTWNGSGAALFRIYRRGEAGGFAPLGDTAKSPYIDTTAEFGKTYIYSVQGLQESGESTSESDISEYVTITPNDVFPPAIPAGLKAIVGASSVELSWDRNTEPDLAGYSLFRGEGAGPWAPIADKLAAPSYSDRAVKPGGHYRYVVSSFDQSGNASDKSAPVEVAVP